MALTAKIKLLRVLSVLQCWVAVWVFVLGIVEQVRATWVYSQLGLAIWISVWVAFTGTFGVLISFKQVQITSHGCFIPPHLVMTFMGFSMTCGVLSTLFLFLYSAELAISSAQELRMFLYFSIENEISAKREARPGDFNSRHKEEHALVGSIYGFIVVELILAMWSVAICFVSDKIKTVSEDENGGDPLMTPTGQEESSRIVTGGFGFVSNT